jgi:acetylornithine/succinyldiaminopimelate/putrescine aminotransferase
MMTKVAYINKLSGQHVAGFSGKKSYEDAIKSAESWAKRTGTELISYYEQIHGGKSILVGYNKLESSDKLG